MKKVRQINKGCIREGSTWLICICLTPVQKDALSFLLIFFFPLKQLNGSSVVLKKKKRTPLTE